jgi:YaeQ protein
MSGKYSFTLRSEDRRRPLPSKIIIGRQETETIQHVGLKLLAYCYFLRDRLQMEPNLDNANIPFVPDLVQLDYELRPILWVECGDGGAHKLHKLAVKAPEAQIWAVKPSLDAAHDLLRAMAHDGLRANRYAFAEFCGLMAGRNQLAWYKTTLEPPGAPRTDHLPPDHEPELHFDFNGLWFQMPFHLLKF